MILSQNQAEQREDVTNDFENINEIKRFVWNYKATLVIFLLNLAGFVLTEIYGNKIYNLYACNAYRVKKLHEYYRLFTSNYLHFG